MSNGNEYSFAFNGSPDVTKGEFNSLESLSKAIDHTNVPELQSFIMNNNQMKIELNDNKFPDVRIISCNGESNIAADIGLEVNSIFRDGINQGDKFEIAIGDHNNITSSNYFNLSDIFGELTEVQSVNTNKNPIFGATTVDGVLNMKDGDGFKINTNSGSVDFIYQNNAPSAASGQFNSLTTLKEAINANNNFSAGIDSGQLTIKPDGTNSTHIKSIEEINSNFASTLGILRSESVVNDTADINLSTGEKYQFIFKGNEPIDVSKGEFNNLSTLKQAIAEVTEGKVSSEIEHGHIRVSYDEQVSHSINSISGNMADYLGISASSRTIQMKFSGERGGSSVSGRPDTSQGEFNDIATLTKAINALGDNDVKSQIIENGKKIKIEPIDSAKIPYINDIKGSIAEKLGLHSADIVSALGVNLL